MAIRQASSAAMKTVLTQTAGALPQTNVQIQAALQTFVATKSQPMRSVSSAEPPESLGWESTQNSARRV